MFFAFGIFLFLLSTVMTYSYIRLARKKLWLDIPCQRSSHVQATPRGGGVVFTILWVLTSLLALTCSFWDLKQALVLVPGVCVVAITGFLDDRYSLSAKVRALVYSLAACFSLYCLGGFENIILSQTLHLNWAWLGTILAFFAIVWSVNLFNFMDGIDGIASLEAVFTIGVGGALLYLSGGENLAFLAWALIACVAGFLVWNKPPAKLFMGDAGSTALGFSIMVLALLGEKLYKVPALLWLILYGVFAFDATVTLARRLYAGEPFYKAHRSHAYQRLQGYWNHRQILLGLVVLNSILSLMAILGFFYQEYILLLGFLALVLLSFLYVKIERIQPMFPNR